MKSFLSNILIVLTISTIARADIIKISDGLYFEQKADDLFFVMERVKSENFPNWLSYKNKQHEIFTDCNSWHMPDYLRYIRDNNEKISTASFEQFWKSKDMLEMQEEYPLLIMRAIERPCKYALITGLLYVELVIH